MPARCSRFTMALNSSTCWPRCPEEEKRESGQKKPIEL